MPDITDTSTWEKCVPNFGGNRKLERPFYFLVKGNLTIQERDAYVERMSALAGSGATNEQLAEFLGEYIQMGDEPLSVKGEPVTTLLEYLKLLERFAASQLISELLGWVPYVNSVEGARALFFQQRFGGVAFMTLPINAKAEATKARR